MALRDQPYFPFYVKDFSDDTNLRECDAESTGVFIRIMCLMHKSKTYGKLLLEQKYQQKYQQMLQQTSQHGVEICSDFVGAFAVKLLKHLPYDLLQIQRGLCQLIENDVCQVEGDYLCQRRMIKDGDISEKRSQAGKKSASGRGGAKNFVGTKHPTNKSTKGSTKDQQITAYAYGNANSIDIEGVSNNTRGGTGEENFGGEEGKGEIDFNLHERSAGPLIELTRDDMQILRNASDGLKQAWSDWVNYLAVEKKKFLNSIPAKNAAYEDLMRLAEMDDATAIKIIRQSIKKTWAGFFKLQAENPKSGTSPKSGKIISASASIEEQEEFYKRVKRD